MTMDFFLVDGVDDGAATLVIVALLSMLLLERMMINQLCDRRPCYGAPHPGMVSDTNPIRQASRSYLY